MKNVTVLVFSSSKEDLTAVGFPETARRLARGVRPRLIRDNRARRIEVEASRPLVV